MHGSEHEDWCAAVAAGDVDVVPAELVRDIERCPQCAPLLTNLRALQSTLARVGAEEHAIVEAALAMSPLPGEEAITRRLREVAGVAQLVPTRPTAWRSLRRPLLALAAALAIGFVGLLVWRANAPERDQVLGTDELVCVAPIGEIEQLVPFEWRYALKPGWYFEVAVRAADGTATVLAASGRLRANTWTPPEPDRAKIEVAGKFEWSVQVFDDSRGFQRAASASAALRR